MISTRSKIEGHRPLPSDPYADHPPRSQPPSTTVIDYKPTSSGTTMTFSFNPSSSSSPEGSFDEYFNQESIDLMSSIDGLLGFHEKDRVDQSVRGLIDDQMGGMSDHLEDDDNDRDDDRDDDNDGKEEVDGKEDIDYDDVLSVSDSSHHPIGR